MIRNGIGIILQACRDYMRDINILRVCICYSILFAAMMTYRWYKNHHLNKKGIGKDALICVYLTIVCSITLLGRKNGQATQWIYWIPLSKIRNGSLGFWCDYLFNLLLFIPMGFIAYEARNRALKVLLIFGCPMLIEVVQAFTGRGVFELFDIIANCMGAVLGYVLSRQFIRWKANNSKNRSSAQWQSDSVCILLDMIKAAYHGSRLDNDETLNWEDILAETQIQAITSFVTPALPTDIPEKIRDKWKMQELAQVARFVQMLHLQRELCYLMNEANIRFAILKGCAVACYYPKAQQRHMGDIDFIVPASQLRHAYDLLIKNGYSPLNGDFNPEKREMQFMKNGIEYELHSRFSDYGIDIESYIINGLDYVQVKSINGSEFPCLPELENGLVLLAHISNHLHEGLGLRQVIDWMMYVDRVLDDAFWEAEFSIAAKQTKLDILAITVTHLCQMFLGLNQEIHWCQSADEDLCRELMQFLLLSGNFGRRKGAGNNIERVTIAIKRNGLFRYLQTAGESNWRLYHKHQWLKPFCWLYQIGRYCHQAIRTRRGKTIASDIYTGKQRYDMLKRLNISCVRRW